MGSAVMQKIDVLHNTHGEGLAPPPRAAAGGVAHRTRHTPSGILLEVVFRANAESMTYPWLSYKQARAYERAKR